MLKFTLCTGSVSKYVWYLKETAFKFFDILFVFGLCKNTVCFPDHIESQTIELLVNSELESNYFQMSHPVVLHNISQLIIGK
jgi:hypothetical protein